MMARSTVVLFAMALGVGVLAAQYFFFAPSAGETETHNARLQRRLDEERARIIAHGNPSADSLLERAALLESEGKHTDAIPVYLAAASLGSAKAAARLGDIYDRGIGVPRDYAEASKWYRLAGIRGCSGGGAEQSPGMTASGTLKTSCLPAGQ